MKYNLLWIFIDSVRRYHSIGDDRSRLNIMDEFGKDSIEFLNVVTNAPSTFQSLSAMASGVNSYFTNRNFTDFIFDNETFPSITYKLRRVCYYCYSFLMLKDTRESMINIFPMIERKYWPKGFTHRKSWSNSDINKAIDKTLFIGVERPSFFFVDYNCRKDPQTSNKVKWAFNRFKEAGHTEENTITILCSDHGYPDPSKVTGRPEFYEKYNLTHDLILTDDNIMIPLFIQYPGCPKGKKVETTIGSIDIYPTVMDILGIDIKHKIHGKSLLPLINNDGEYRRMMESRFHRCDSRLACQTGRGTAIRNGEYKYIYYHDKVRGRNQEEFFDLKEDKYEQHNLINSSDTVIQNRLNVFRKEFQRSENDAFRYQLKYLFGKFSNKYGCGIKKAKEILLTDSCSPVFLDMLIKMLQKLNRSAIISILKVEHEFNFRSSSVNIIDSGSGSWTNVNLKDLLKRVNNLNIDFLFVPYNISEQRDNNQLRKIVRRIKASQKIYLDYNMESYKKTIDYYWKRFKTIWSFIKYEPSYLILYFKPFLNKRLKSILGLKKENWKDIN
ncbi:hypothetical protein KAX02_09430 [candidate division WOR-3 bacterium]|nr:hypothetical protein [candidate division WOR-3 bacterium]